MKQKSNQASRRGFLTGMLTGLGAASVAVAAGKTARAAKPEAEQPSGQVLYRRTAETERYYKTLYT